ncbi:hypothetical protein RLJV_23815 [Pseudomonas aeruginosa]|nr:hypothetical protein RLJV_23815 [Pseudomonas aeruginosa]
MVNRMTKATANSIGVSKVSEPSHMVVTQLNTFTVAEQRLAREGRDDRTDRTEGGQDHDVHLGVAEEPEHVLEQHRVAAAGCPGRAG